MEEENIIIEDGLIVTMNKERKILKGSIYIEEGRIIDIDSTDNVKSKYSAEEKVNAEGAIVMPGIMCSHTHLYGVLLRGAFLKTEPPTDFIQILQRVWWPMDEELSLEDAYASALASSLESLRKGVTFFADTYSGPNSIEGSLDKIAEAVKRVGVRGILAFEATNRHGSEEGERGVKENTRFIKKIQRKGNGKILGMYSIHASFTASDELLIKVHKLSDKYRVPLTIHTSEGLVDLYFNLQKYGKRTVERLADIGVLGSNTVLAHCVHVNKDEIGIIAGSRAGIAHNPMSNMLNAVGVSPVPEMIKKGVKIGLGNDGYILDPFENMRAAYLIHKVNYRDPRIITPIQVLEMATVNVAKLYGLEKELGSLEKGKKADIIVIKPRIMPTPLTPETVLGHLINTVNGGDVEHVLVNGEIIMKNRRILSVNVEEVNQTCQGSAEKLWSRLREIKPQLDFPPN